MAPVLGWDGFTISSYLVVLAFALGAATGLMVCLGGRVGIGRWRALVLAACAIIVGYGGSTAQSIVFEAGLTDWTHGRHAAGLAGQGGLILGGVALGITARLTRVPWADAMDVASASAAVGLGVGRIGCLLAGCCWGKPTLFPIALVFSDFRAGARPIGVPLHATQVYSSLTGWLLLAYLVLFRLPRRRFRGQAICEFVMLYGAARFVLEFLRADPRGPVWLGLAFTQVIALVFALIALGVWMVAARSRRRAP